MKINVQIEKRVADDGHITFHVTSKKKDGKQIYVVEELGNDAYNLYQMITRHGGADITNG